MNGALSEPYKPKRGNVALSDEDLRAMVSYIQGTEQPLRDY